MVAAVLGLLLWGASAAVAGGPTSVLVTSPQSAQATARYYSDAEYGRLQELLGPENTGAREAPEDAGLTRARQINVTWLVHDMSPWRLDRVFPVDSKARTVWIHTTTDVTASGNGYWHRAEHPAELRALLEKLGVMGPVTDGKGYGGVFPAPWQSDPPAGSSAAPAPPAEEEAVTKVSVTTGSEDGTDWWWSLPGAAAGAVLALLIRPLAARVAATRRSTGRTAEPRQELRDI